MSDIQPYAPGLGDISRPVRQAARAVGRIRGTAVVRIEAADASTEVVIAKVENQTMATAAAMQAVTRTARTQRELEQQAPEVSARLALLADDHALACAEILGQLHREMRRA